MGIIYDKTVIESQDNVALIKAYIEKYEEILDETVSEIEDETEVITIKKSKKERKQKTTDNCFHVILSSGLDTIIEKRLQRSTVQIILMPSQNKYLIKNNNRIQDIAKMSMDEFKQIFKFLKNDDEIKINNIVFNTIKNDDISNIYEMIKKYPDLLSEGMMSFSFYNRMHKTGYNLYKELLESKTLLKYITMKTPFLEGSKKYDLFFIKVAIYLNENVGYDIARYFIDAFSSSSLVAITNDYHSYNRFDTFTELLNPKYGLNPKRLIEYLCFDIYGQGFTDMPLLMYRNYLEMQFLYYGKSKMIKYPKMLMTEYDIIVQKINLNSEILKEVKDNPILSYQSEFREALMHLKENEDFPGFRKRYKEFKEQYHLDSNIIYKNNGIELLLPESSQELIAEGINLKHCVSSYIPSISSGECIIAFARKESKPELSYLTVEIRTPSKNDSPFYIAQIQGKNRRITLTAKEKNFFNS